MWPYTRIAIFALATIVLAYVFRASLRHPRSHGFYRFFVFEAILAQFLIALPLWFHDPFSLPQLISWAFLLGSLILVVAGVRDLHIHGRPDASARQEPELLAFERTSRLVHEGVFHHIRHPLYASLLLLTWGIFFKSPTGGCAALAIVSTTGLVLMANAEEAECVRFFGQEYREYMRHTRRFIPHVY